jgi:hypothetical protein
MINKIASWLGYVPAPLKDDLDRALASVIRLRSNIDRAKASIMMLQEIKRDLTEDRDHWKQCEQTASRLYDTECRAHSHTKGRLTKAVKANARLRPELTDIHAATADRFEAIAYATKDINAPFVGRKMSSAEVEYFREWRRKIYIMAIDGCPKGSDNADAD